MNLSCEALFEFPEVKPVRTPGPLEKLWQSPSGFGTMFLSGEEVCRREQEAKSLGVREAESRLLGEHEGELTRLRAEVAGVLAAFERQRDEYFQRVEKEVVRLAIAIARKVIGRELQLDPGSLTAAVKEILRRINREGDVTVRVSPEKVTAWEAALARDVAGASLEIRPDPDLNPWRCVLDTSLGTTVVDPFAELDDIEEAMMRTTNESSAPAESTMVQ